MKKLLLIPVAILGFAIAANAQSNSKKNGYKPTPNTTMKSSSHNQEKKEATAKKSKTKKKSKSGYTPTPNRNTQSSSYNQRKKKR